MRLVRAMEISLLRYDNDRVHCQVTKSGKCPHCNDLLPYPLLTIILATLPIPSMESCASLSGGFVAANAAE